MKKILLGLGVFVFAGCASTTESFYQQKNYGQHCPNPKFVTSVYLSGAYDKVSLHQCLKLAKEKYGDDVSINNVHWDIFQDRKFGVIFDVVKCK